MALTSYTAPIINSSHVPVKHHQQEYLRCQRGNDFVLKLRETYNTIVRMLQV